MHQLVEECSGLFENVRSVKVAYHGLIRPMTKGYEQSRATFQKMLGQAQKLECLEIHNRNEDYVFPGFRDPQRTVDLIDSLASHTSPQLTELRLYDMMPIVRSLPMVLSALSKKLPKLRKIAISINEDLLRIGQELPDGTSRYRTDFETALHEATPHTCWVSTFLSLFSQMSDTDSQIYPGIPSDAPNTLRRSELQGHIS